jgi:hypothetical protein
MPEVLTAKLTGWDGREVQQVWEGGDGRGGGILEHRPSRTCI